VHEEVTAVTRTGLDEGRMRETKLSRARFLQVAAAGAGLLAIPGIASCGLGGGEGGGQASLRLAGFADYQKATNTMIERYREQNPDVDFQTSYAPVDQLQSSLRPQLASGNAPDIHTVWPGNGNALAMVPLVSANLLVPLSDQPWADKIPESYKPVFTVDDETYFFAPTSSMIGAIYNKKVFEDLGLQIPQTWDELLSTCEEIKADGKHPIALGNQTPWVTQLINYALVASTVFAKNPDFAEQHLEGETSFPESGWRDAFEKYMELNERGYFNPNPLGTTYEQQLQMVASGEAAMCVQTSGGIPQIEGYGEPGQFAMFAFPGVNDPEKVWIPAAAGNGFGVNTKSDHVEESKAFVTFLAETKNMNDFANMTSGLPLIPNEQFEVPRSLESMMPFVEQDKSVPYMDQRWPNPEVQQVHFAVVQELFSGKTTIDEALRRMEVAYDKGA
jgi:raffinose/stachyose/melibiose transport system substrate-binding protein